MWQRDTKGICYDEYVGSSTINCSSILNHSYMIKGLEEYSTYIITVTAINFIGNATSSNFLATTKEAGIYVGT